MPIKRKFLMIAGIAVIAFAGLNFAKADAVALPDPAIDERAVVSPASIVLAGGCFWGMQAVFQHTKGVVSAVSGYAGGDAGSANYETVSTGTTGHAESVKVTYDPSQITLGRILKIYFSVAHDPTELNYQGPDHGSQYRSTIFYATPEQQKIAHAYIDQIDQDKIFSSPLVTTLEPLKAFYPAESYHQDYARLHPDNPYIRFNDLPKVAALKKQYPEFYKP